MQSRWLYPLLALLMLAGITLAMRQGIASAFHFKSVFYLDSWHEGKIATAQSYQDAKAAAEHAVKLDSANPHYRLMLARTLEWGHYQQLEPIDTARLQALYNTALAQRPAWGDGYTAYAYALAWVLNQPAAAAEQILLADAHGPYMPRPLLLSVRLANDFWPQLPAEFKAQYFRNQLKLAKAYYPVYREFVSLSRNSPLQAVQCAYLHQQALSSAEFSRLQRDLCRHWPKITG
ncbi:hypothetical protein [Rheinheimera sp.]|uniref:hypothetical protein n=1 Tax=Rheinheimera sp. TaxID=1869214 RepID=UPI002736E068|nr:hypothetical protein [Rheinheimera sp.]MDP2715759.1 hypothetical protein [Rheinheimera sp.]